ncbi:MAG: hypothetical protein ABFC98_01205 [Candidatus Cloacimonas sp.]
MKSWNILLIILMVVLCGTADAQIAQIVDFFVPQNVPATTQESFVRYMRGGYLTSGTYYQYLTPEKGFDHIESASIVLLHYSWSKFASQTVPKALPMVTFGILDNVSTIQGSFNGDLKNSYFIDLASLSGSYTIPLLNYGAYANAGIKAAATYDAPFADKLTALGVEHLFVKSIEYEYDADNYANRVTKINQPEPYIHFSAEASARLGVRIYNNWFIALALGVRQTPEVKGRWFSKDKVDDWLAGDAYYETDWEYEQTIDKSLPKKVFLTDGTDMFIQLSISPFY